MTIDPDRLDALERLAKACHVSPSDPYADGWYTAADLRCPLTLGSDAEFVAAIDPATIEELIAQARKGAVLAVALRNLVESLADADDEGLIEHAEPVRSAREVLAEWEK
jgi:hypothetical protein